MWIRSIAIVCFGVALTSCSAVSLSDEVQAARAVVTGPANRVYEFHKDLQASLQKVVGDTDPAKIAVVCDLPSVPPGELNCDKLEGESSDPTKVIYTFYRDDKRLKAFIAAWDKTQSRKLSSSLKIQFDTDTPSPDCGGFVGACVAAPFCPGPPKRCDKAQGPPCTACGT